jgi:hypothetical protein
VANENEADIGVISTRADKVIRTIGMSSMPWNGAGSRTAGTIRTGSVADALAIAPDGAILTSRKAGRA